MLKLDEAAFCCNVNPIRIRRLIKSGRIAFKVVKNGDQKFTYYLDPDDLRKSQFVQFEEDRYLALFPGVRLDQIEKRVDELERIIREHGISTELIRSGPLVVREYGELAKRHGIGYWTAIKDWRWTAEAKATPESAVAFIKEMSGPRFKQCSDLSCVCQRVD